MTSHKHRVEDRIAEETIDGFIRALIQQATGDLQVRHQARVTELLEYNNQEVERRRAAEAEARMLRHVLNNLGIHNITSHQGN